MSTVYSRVFSRATGWIIGLIDNHQARPLTEEETDRALNVLNGQSPAIPESLRMKVQAEIDGLMDNARHDCATNRAVARDRIIALLTTESGALRERIDALEVAQFGGLAVIRKDEVLAVLSASPKASADADHEPGDPIAKVHCPACGVSLTIEHGDEPGEISTISEGTHDASREKREAFVAGATAGGTMARQLLHDADWQEWLQKELAERFPLPAQPEGGGT